MKLLIGLISHKPLIDFRVMLDIQSAVISLSRIGWQAVLLPCIGNADLAGARNVLFAEAHHRKFDKLLFVDADISWDHGAIERLALHDVDLVGGFYRFKKDEVKYAGTTIPGSLRCIDPATGEPQPFGLCEVRNLPTGLLCISRGCMEKMVNGYDDLWYNEPQTTGGKAWEVFEFKIVERERMTEDFNFCRLWREIGGRVWCDPHLMLHHHGDKTYSGKFVEHLRDIGRLDEGNNAAAPSLPELSTV